MTKVQNTNVSAATQVENKKVKKQQQKKEQQVFKGNGNKQTVQKPNDSALKQEIYKKTGFQLKDTKNRGQIIKLKVNGKVREYETVGTLTTGGRILVKEKGKEVYHVVSHTPDKKTVMLKDDYARNKVFYETTSAEHKVKIGKKNYIITNSKRDRHGRMTAINSRGQEVILSHDGKELKHSYVEAEDQKDNLNDYIAQQTKGKSKAEANKIRQQIMDGNSSYSSKGVLRFKASNGEVWYYDTKRKTYVKYAEKEAQAIIKDLDKGAKEDWWLFRTGLGTDYELLKNTNAQIIDPEVLNKINKHYSTEYGKKVDKNAEYGSGKYKTAYEAFLASEIGDDEVYLFNATLVKNKAITDQSRRNEILQTNLTKISGIGIEGLGVGVNKRANRMAAADAASTKEDYQTLQDAAEDENIKNNYKPQFKGQDALQTYIYGVHDGDVQEIDDFNNALIDPKENMLDRDEIVRIKAETGVLWLKEGNFKKGFEAQDNDVTKQMFALQNPNGKAVLNANTLKQQAAKDKQEDYMMMARPDLYSDKELASRATQLLKDALLDLNNYHSVEFQSMRSLTGNYDIYAQGKVDFIKDAEENISRAYSMIRNDKILAMVKKEMGNNYNLLIQREQEHLKTNNLKNITTITDTQVTEHTDNKGEVKLTPEQIAHNKYVVTWLKSQLSDIERDKKFNEAKEGWKQGFVNNTRDLLFGGVTRASLADKYNLIKSNMARLEAAAEGKLVDASGKPVSFEDAMKNLGETGIQALEQANAEYQTAQQIGEFMVDMVALALPLPKSFNAANTVIKMGNALYKVISKSDKACKVVKITQEAAKGSKIYEVTAKIATKNPKLVENTRKVATIMDSSATGAMHMELKTAVLEGTNIATSREGFTSDRISEMNEKVKSAGKFGGMGGAIGGTTGMLAEYVSSTGAKYVVHGLGLVADVTGAAGLMTAESHGETNFWDNLRCVNPDGSFNFEQATMTAMMIYGHLHGASTVRGKSKAQVFDEITTNNDLQLRYQKGNEGSYEYFNAEALKWEPTTKEFFNERVARDGVKREAHSVKLENRELRLDNDGIWSDAESGRKFRLAKDNNGRIQLAELTKKEIYNSRQKTEVKDGMTLEDFRQELKNNDLRGNVYTKADGGRLVVVKHSFNKYELYEFDTNSKMISQKSVKGKSAIKESYPEFANVESSGTIGSTSGYLGMNNLVGNGNNTKKVEALQDNVKKKELTALRNELGIKQSKPGHSFVGKTDGANTVINEMKNNDIVNSYIVSRDTKGKAYIAEKVSYKNGKAIDKIEYVHDENGNVIKEIHKGDNLTREILKDAEGNVLEIVENVYDSQGNLQKTIHKDAQGNIKSEFDPNKPQETSKSENNAQVTESNKPTGTDPASHSEAIAEESKVTKTSTANDKKPVIASEGEAIQSKQKPLSTEVPKATPEQVAQVMNSLTVFSSDQGARLAFVGKYSTECANIAKKELIYTVDEGKSVKYFPDKDISLIDESAITKEDTGRIGTFRIAVKGRVSEADAKALMEHLFDKGVIKRDADGRLLTKSVLINGNNEKLGEAISEFLANKKLNSQNPIGHSERVSGTGQPVKPTENEAIQPQNTAEKTPVTTQKQRTGNTQEQAAVIYNEEVKTAGVTPVQQTKAQQLELERLQTLVQSKEGKAILADAMKDPNFGKPLSERVPDEGFKMTEDGRLQIEVDGVVYTQRNEGDFRLVSSDGKILEDHCDVQQKSPSATDNPNLTRLYRDGDGKIFGIENQYGAIVYNNDSLVRGYYPAGKPNTILDLSLGRAIENYIMTDNVGRVLYNTNPPQFSAFSEYHSTTIQGSGHTMSDSNIVRDLNQAIQDVNLKNTTFSTKKGRQKAYEDVRTQIENAYKDNKLTGQDYENLVANLNSKAEKSGGLIVRETRYRQHVAKIAEAYETNRDLLSDKIDKVATKSDYDNMVVEINEAFKSGKIDREAARVLNETLDAKGELIEGVETLSQKKAKIEKQVGEIETAQRIEAAEAKSRPHAELLDEYLAESGENLSSEIGSKEYYDEALSTIDRGVKNGSIEPQKAEVLRTQLKEQLAKLESESNQPVTEPPATEKSVVGEKSQATEKPVNASEGEAIQSPFEITADKFVVNGKEQSIPTFEEAQRTLKKYGGNQYSIETGDGNRLIFRYDDNGKFIGSREEISINGKALKDTSRNADGTIDKTIDYFHTNDGKPVLIERDSNSKPTKIKWYKRNITFDKEGKASYEVTNEKNETINKSIEEVLKDSPELKPLLEKQGIKLVEESNSPVPPVVENKGEGTPASENNGKGELKTPAQEIVQNVEKLQTLVQNKDGKALLEEAKKDPNFGKTAEERVPSDKIVKDSDGNIQSIEIDGVTYTRNEQGKYVNGNSTAEVFVNTDSYYANSNSNKVVVINQNKITTIESKDGVNVDYDTITGRPEKVMHSYQSIDLKTGVYKHFNTEFDIAGRVTKQKLCISIKNRKYYPNKVEGKRYLDSNYDSKGKWLNSDLNEKTKTNLSKQIEDAQLETKKAYEDVRNQIEDAYNNNTINRETADNLHAKLNEKAKANGLETQETPTMVAEREALAEWNKQADTIKGNLKSEIEKVDSQTTHDQMVEKINKACEYDKIDMNRADELYDALKAKAESLGNVESLTKKAERINNDLKAETENHADEVAGTPAPENSGEGSTPQKTPATAIEDKYPNVPKIEEVETNEGLQLRHKVGDENSYEFFEPEALKWEPTTKEFFEKMTSRDGVKSKATYQNIKNADGSTVQRFIDANGKKVKKIFRNKDGKVTGSNEYVYDVDGKMSKKISKNKDDKVSISTEYKYNEFGKESERIIKDGKGNVIYSEEYKYDKSGNQIEFIHKDENGKIINSTEYKYNEFGKKSEIIHKDENGNPEDSTVFKYDANGKLSLEYEKDSKGEIVSSEEYKYNADDKLSKTITRDKDGNITIIYDDEHGRLLSPEETNNYIKKSLENDINNIKTKENVDEYIAELGEALEKKIITEEEYYDLVRQAGEKRKAEAARNNAGKVEETNNEGQPVTSESKKQSVTIEPEKTPDGFPKTPSKPEPKPKMLEEIFGDEQAPKTAEEAKKYAEEHEEAEFVVDKDPNNCNKLFLDKKQNNIVFYNKDGTINSYREISPSKGVRRRDTELNPDGTVKSVKTCATNGDLKVEYYEKGNLQEKQLYSNENNVWTDHVIIFDSEGNMTKARKNVQNKEKNSWKTTAEYEYNADNNVFELKKEGKVVSTVKYDEATEHWAEYDAEGNLVYEIKKFGRRKGSFRARISKATKNIIDKFRSNKPKNKDGTKIPKKFRGRDDVTYDRETKKYTERTEKNGVTIETIYDSKGRLEQRTAIDSTGRTERIYDSKGRLVQEVDGNKTKYYNPKGEVIAEQEITEHGIKCTEKSKDYDLDVLFNSQGEGEKITIKYHEDKKGNTAEPEEFTYNKDSKVFENKGPEGTVFKTVEYDAKNHKWTIKDAEGKKIDSQNNMKESHIKRNIGIGAGVLALGALAYGIAPSGDDKKVEQPTKPTAKPASKKDTPAPKAETKVTLDGKEGTIAEDGTLTLDGKPYPKDTDGTYTIGDKKYKVEDGKLVEVVDTPNDNGETGGAAPDESPEVKGTIDDKEYTIKDGKVSVDGAELTPDENGHYKIGDDKYKIEDGKLVKVEPEEPAKTDAGTDAAQSDDSQTGGGRTGGSASGTTGTTHNDTSRPVTTRPSERREESRVNSVRPSVQSGESRANSVRHSAQSEESRANSARHSAQSEEARVNSARHSERSEESRHTGNTPVTGVTEPTEAQKQVANALQNEISGISTQADVQAFVEKLESAVKTGQITPRQGDELRNLLQIHVETLNEAIKIQNEQDAIPEPEFGFGEVPTQQQPQRKEKREITPMERMELTESIRNARDRKDIEKIQQEMRQYKVFPGRKNLRRAYKAKLRAIKHQDEPNAQKYNEKFNKRMEKVSDDNIKVNNAEFMKQVSIDENLRKYRDFEA